MSINTCRTCGKVETNEMKAFITDEVCENVTYQEQLEHIIGIKLKDENEFPQKICDLCKNHLELITNLSVIWKENERALNAPSSCQTPTASTSRATTPTQDVGEILETPKIKRKRCKSESDDNPFFFYEKNREGMSSALQKKTKSYTSLHNVKDLFARELAFMDVLRDLNSYTHIRVDLENVLENGEISNDYLQMYNGTMRWSQFSYLCDHCNENIEGLLAYMDHQRNAGIKHYKIKCAEENCTRDYWALYSYINHCVTDHQEHLAFTCVLCVPSRIFYNTICLLNHYLESHLDMNFSFFMCIQCGTYTQSITQLRVHKMTQHDKFVDLDEETDSSDEDGTRKKQARVNDSDWTPLQAITPRQTKSSTNLAAKSNILKRTKSTANLNLATSSGNGESSGQFHPKVRELGNRQTYPCTFEGCNRILVTTNGYAYHMLTHTGEKPFACHYCTARYRSKKVCENHERLKHCT